MHDLRLPRAVLDFVLTVDGVQKDRLATNHGQQIDNFMPLHNLPCVQDEDRLPLRAPVGNGLQQAGPNLLIEAIQPGASHLNAGRNMRLCNVRRAHGLEKAYKSWAFNQRGQRAHALTQKS